MLASVGGLYTSIVVKYTDNIMKGFSAAAAIVISTVASVILFGLQISKWSSEAGAAPSAWPSNRPFRSYTLFHCPSWNKIMRLVSLYLWTGLISRSEKNNNNNLALKKLFTLCPIYTIVPPLSLSRPPTAVAFAAGAMMVCLSIYLYGLPKQDTAKPLQQSADSAESKQKLITV